jgi:hypothetical protein
MHIEVGECTRFCIFKEVFMLACAEVQAT